MNRKTFFKSIAALGVAVGIAPKVLAEKRDDPKSHYKVFTLGVEKGAPANASRSNEFRSTSVKNIGHGRYTIRAAGPYMPARVASIVSDERGNSFWVQGIKRTPEYSEVIVWKLYRNSMEFPRPGLFVAYAQTMTEG